MIGRLQRTDREQRKMLLSILANFLTRIPGVVGLVWFLPLLHQGLGTEDYASLLSGIALANAASFLCGGLSIMGRRTIGAAYAKADKPGEASGFMSLVTSNALGTCLAAIIILLYCSIFHTSYGFRFSAWIALLGLFLQVCADMITAYNESYVASGLLIAFQTAFYTTGFLVPMTRESVVFASVVLVGPYLLGNLCTVGLLLMQRKYLVSCRVLSTWPMLRQATLLALADGLMVATLSLAVVWIQTTTDASTSAWFATVVRLFQTFLVPISLALFPLSGYVRMRWDEKSRVQQRKYTRTVLLIGLSYGTLVAAALFVASRFYISLLLHLPVRGGVWIFVLFAAIIAYRSYSSIAYVVLDRTAHLAFFTTAAIATALAVGVGAGLRVAPMTAIDIYAAIAASAIIAILVWSATLFIRESVMVGERAVSP